MAKLYEQIDQILSKFTIFKQFFKEKFAVFQFINDIDDQLKRLEKNLTNESFSSAEHVYVETFLAIKKSYWDATDRLIHVKKQLLLKCYPPEPIQTLLADLEGYICYLKHLLDDITLTHANDCENNEELENIFNEKRRLFEEIISYQNEINNMDKDTVEQTAVDKIDAALNLLENTFGDVQLKIKNIIRDCLSTENDFELDNLSDELQKIEEKCLTYQDRLVWPKISESIDLERTMAIVAEVERQVHDQKDEMLEEIDDEKNRAVQLETEDSFEKINVKLQRQSTKVIEHENVMMKMIVEKTEDVKGTAEVVQMFGQTVHNLERTMNELKGKYEKVLEEYDEHKEILKEKIRDLENMNIWRLKFGFEPGTQTGSFLDKRDINGDEMNEDVDEKFTDKIEEIKKDSEQTEAHQYESCAAHHLAILESKYLDDKYEDARPLQTLLDTESLKSFGEPPVTHVTDENNVYLKNIFGKILPPALAEIVAVKPNDPVEYLGRWLHKYRANTTNHHVQKMMKKRVDCLNNRLRKQLRYQVEPIINDIMHDAADYVYDNMEFSRNSQETFDDYNTIDMDVEEFEDYRSTDSYSQLKIIEMEAASAIQNL